VFKTDNFDIAQRLIEQGTTVKSCETSAINKWAAPGLHDSI
jgi:hypothetical protein